MRMHGRDNARVHSSHLKPVVWAAALRAGQIRVTGPSPLARALPTWNRRV